MPSNAVRLSAEPETGVSEILAEPIRVREYDERVGQRLVGGLRQLLEERVLLFRLAGYGLALATVLAFLVPARYEARTALMPPDSELGSGLASLLAMTAKTGNGLGMLAGDMLGLKTSGSLFIGILRSHTVEDRIIGTFDLQAVYREPRLQDARQRLEDDTQIAEDRKSGIIVVGVTSHDPQRAAAIARAYVEELDRLVAELNTSAAHRERLFLEERLKSVKLDLDATAKEFSEFASKNVAIDIKEQGRAMVEAAAALQGQLIAAQAEAEGLRQIYTESNVRVRTVRARIEELRKRLEQMGGGEAGPGEKAGSDSFYPSIRKLPLLGVPYAELYRRTKIQETLFELLTQQRELARVQEAKETPSVKVLDVAAVPEKKSFPPRLEIMGLGALFAPIFGAMWVLGKTRWEQLDSRHPGKVLVQDVYAAMKADFERATDRHASVRSVRERLLRFKRPAETE